MFYCIIINESSQKEKLLFSFKADDIYTYSDLMFLYRKQKIVKNLASKV